jgi:hypothetical protein
MNFPNLESFNSALEKHAEKRQPHFYADFRQQRRKTVSGEGIDSVSTNESFSAADVERENDLPPQILSSLEKSDVAADLTAEKLNTLKVLSKVSPHFAGCWRQILI